MSSTMVLPSFSPTFVPSSLQISPTSFLMPTESRKVASISSLDDEVSGQRSVRRVSFEPSFVGRKVNLTSNHSNRGDSNRGGRDCKVHRAVNVIRSSTARRPLKIMISGAPASGKGTQCELIAEKFGLIHISAGDLLRAEVASGTTAGMIAKEYMNNGKLVPSEIVVSMVKNRLAEPDTRNGWLLDGYPRSLEQAEALEAVGIRPELFILLDVPDNILVERIVGRRSDPLTGKIYHLTFSPPENEEIARRLVQRSDDIEEKVKARVDTYHANLNSVVGVYKDVVKIVDGDRHKLEVFAEIESFLSILLMEGSPAF